MKFLRAKDLARLRGKAAKSTHLARYDRANDLGTAYVLQVQCPDCHAPAGAQCYGKN